MQFFLIGIKGTGMSSLAITLQDLGNEVSGSDVNDEYFTCKSLKEKNIKWKPFNKSNIDNGECIYIISSCYGKDNEEVSEVLKNNYKYYYYHEFLEYFFKGIKIGVSGSHGKTTTTSFIKDLFRDKKTCAIVGNGYGHGKIDYDYFIFEACEYQDHILSYTYDYLIINNIDIEHLDYFNNKEDIYNTFKKASKNAKNIIIYEGIDINHKSRFSFGKSKDNFSYYEIIGKNESGYELRIVIDNQEMKIKYSFTGEHMINNLLAALTVYYLCFKDLTNIENIVNTLSKPIRRMTEYIYKNNILIDDYAHHPTEIEALISACKQKYPTRKIVVLFQPHTYSRTFTLESRFKECFKGIDELYIDNTFTSKREKIDEELEKKVIQIFNKGKRFNIDVIKDLKNKENLIIIFLGAGVINQNIKYFTNEE